MTMTYRSTHLMVLMICFTFSILNMVIMSSAYAEQQAEFSKIQGKVIEIIDVTAYTYAKVDVGNAEVWAAGPTTALKIG